MAPRFDIAKQVKKLGADSLLPPPKRKVAYISINGQTIRKNAVTGSKDAPIRIGKSPSDQHPRYAHEIAIDGPSKLIYSPTKPIVRCGARLVLTAAYDDVRIVR